MRCRNSFNLDVRYESVLGSKPESLVYKQQGNSVILGKPNDDIRDHMHAEDFSIHSLLLAGATDVLKDCPPLSLNRFQAESALVEANSIDNQIRQIESTLNETE